jgi:hypothetical protein
LSVDPRQGTTFPFGTATIATQDGNVQISNQLDCSPDT